MRYLEQENLSDKSKKLAELVKERFTSIKGMAEATGFTRATIYMWLDNGVIPSKSCDVLRGRGFDPKTLIKKEISEEASG